MFFNKIWILNSSSGVQDQAGFIPKLDNNQSTTPWYSSGPDRAGIFATPS